MVVCVDWFVVGNICKGRSATLTMPAVQVLLEPIQVYLSPGTFFWHNILALFLTIPAF